MADKQPAIKARPTFTLEGHSFVGDKRTTPIRGDLADIKLAGLLFAPHYAVPMIRSCILPSAMMHERADGDSTGISELIYGEDFAVLDVSGKWAWGYTVHDDYLGYVDLDALGERPVATHVVTSRSATLLAAPDAKANTLARLHMGAKLVCGEADESGEFLSCDDGYIFRDHVAAVGQVEDDPAALAEKLIGTPYLWGGRSGHAIDCSGLVQLVYGIKGIYLPRDTDLQQDVVGTQLADGEPLRRNDLVYFPGHVGIMQDADTIIHATAHHMQLVAEPLSDVVARNQPEDGGLAITARRRLL
ncbi:C40 family peptidase [Sphingorhabdus arenilitoris]|uniref:C40 family peptidase n=1 Tax=Sphingorhabdus arenilitoris TaxID=1490041 RepID=A0ABV8REJ9_9SPHN